MCVALVVYFLLLGRIAMAFITSGSGAAIGLGVAVLIMPLIGIWVMVSTLQAGLAHQRLARLAREEGMELDVSEPAEDAVRPDPARRGRRVVRDRARRAGQGSGQLACGGTGWRGRTTTRATAAARREAMKKAVELQEAE